LADTEFSLIYQQIAPCAGVRDDVLLGIGDDAAIVQPTTGQSIVVALDTLVSGRHFFPTCAPEDIAWKALAVNLSDLAAMGAVPKWALLSLSLPLENAQKGWIKRFMAGWQGLAQQYAVALIGGDTTRADQLAVSVTLIGEVSPGSAIQRSGAMPGDEIWLSGTIGDAGLALAQRYANQAVDDAVAMRLDRPTPRVNLGFSLRNLATAAIDISDGFLADLGHILKASGNLGARVEVDAMPFSPMVDAWQRQMSPLLPLTSGDDYELLFTAPIALHNRLNALSEELSVALTCVGRVLPSDQGMQLIKNGELLVIPQRQGFDHFASPAIMKTS
jgi:thiamine-monophosphate kinase